MDRLKQLVASLDATGTQSPYLERLRSKIRTRVASHRRDADLDALRRELFAEMAASLGRAEDRINEALLHLDLLGKEVDALEARGTTSSEKVAEFNAARKVAERRIWELSVQRECLGLRRHDILREFFPLPPER